MYGLRVCVRVIYSRGTFYTSSTVRSGESFVDDISQHENVATLIPLLSNVGVADVACSLKRSVSE